MKAMPLILTATLCPTMANTVFAADPAVNQVFVNADGTIAVSNPHFRVGGQQIPVSVESNLDGVCALLGFNNALENGLVPSEDVHRTASLHKNATFKEFVTGKKVEMLMCHFWPNIQCEQTHSSYHNTKHRGRKGLVFLSTTVTCTKPWTGSNARGYPIAYTTSTKTLCPLLRHHSAASSLRPQTLSTATVDLDNNGHFAGFRTGGQQYATLTCHYEERVL